MVQKTPSVADRACVGCGTTYPDHVFGSEELCVYCLNDHVLDEETVEEPPELNSDPEPVTSGPESARKELAARALQRKHLLPFVERFNPKYNAGWVHKDICQRLEQFSRDVTDKKSPRLMLFCPPRLGKSTLASISFPAWHIGNNPDHEIISCSYSGALAMKFSRKVRFMLREPAYQVIFPGAMLDPDSQSAEEWLTTEGGGFVAAGVGGGITGKGAHVLTIDDPTKNREEAESAHTQETIADWFTSTAYTRLAPGGGVLIILTRWNDADLAGWLLEAEKQGGDKWVVVKYPAIATEDEPFRDKGEALHPARYDEEALSRIRKAVGPRDWAALYQQDPVPDTGAYFTRNMLRHYVAADTNFDGLRKYGAWDFAIGKNDRNDYTVGITIGIDQLDNMYIIDVVRKRMDGFEIVESVLDSYETWRHSIIGLEKGHIESAIGPFLEKRVEERKLYEAFFLDLKTGRRDKEARARAIQGRMQQGKVFFPKDAPWVDLLISELLRFPYGEHDDQVDALAWIGLMMTEYAALGQPGVVRKKSWKDTLDTISTRNPGNKKSAMSA